MNDWNQIDTLALLALLLVFAGSSCGAKTVQLEFAPFVVDNAAVD